MTAKEKAAGVLPTPTAPNTDSDFAVALVLQGSAGRNRLILGLRKNPTPGAQRPWLVQWGLHPPFSIHERQLLHRDRLGNVASHALGKAMMNGPDPGELADLSALPPQPVWKSYARILMEGLAALERGAQDGRH